jgi:hypothetical protein
MLSPSQELWMYARLKKHEMRTEKKMNDMMKLICSFINPSAASSMFRPDEESIENTGFYDDIKRMDPNFDKSKYEDVLES